MLRNILIMLLIALSLSSCVRDEGGLDTGNGGTNWKEKPDMSLSSTTLTLYDGENDPITVSAAKADFWTDEARAEMDDFSFIQKDSEGNITLQGSADKAYVDTETNVFELVGAISLISERDGLEIRTDGRVIFSADTEEIEAPGEVEVLNDGSFFSGRDFYGNLRKEEYSFGAILEGRFDV